MSKKLMAILGANAYAKTTYEFNLPGNQTDTYTGYYSTAAIAKALLRNSRADDDFRVVVFLTREARRNNWENRRINSSEKTLEIGKGLEYELKEAVPQLSQRTKTVDIMAGISINELWSIVSTLLNEIEDGDEVYVDITTGYRSIPLLSLLVINYARIIKNNVKIKGIYYGAFEAKNEETGHTPVFDLWPMIEVADWSYAIHSFFKHGSAAEISDLLEGSEGNTTEDPKSYFSSLGNLLKKFSENIHMTRGYDLIFKYEYEDLKKCMNDIVKDKYSNETGSYPVAKALIERISNITCNYGRDDLTNGFSAVRWCVEHNLIHQGFILLQETVVTCLIYMAGLNERKFINNYKLRDLFKRALEMKYNYTNNRQQFQKLTLNLFNSKMYQQLRKNQTIIDYLCNLWLRLKKNSLSNNSANNKQSFPSYVTIDYVKNMIKSNGERYRTNCGDKEIDKDFVKEFINELDPKKITKHMAKEEQDEAISLISFIGNCLTGFAKINGMDDKYSCLMYELSQVRNNLAHGGFNDSEVYELVNIHKKCNPGSDVPSKNTDDLSFKDIMKIILEEICDSMEDIAEYAKQQSAKA